MYQLNCQHKFIILIPIFLLLLNVCAAQSFIEKLEALFYPIIIPDTTEFRQEYDFVIIGSGSGGSVMANRLSEIENVNVLLLEAGDQESFISDVPLTAGMTQITRYNWGYKSAPTKNACRGLQNGVCNWPKGRALGGTSVINFMLYSRGNRRDFDMWAHMGNNGWSYEEVLPYFKKSEKISIQHLKNSPYHGRDGYLDVEYSPFNTKLLKTFLEAGLQLGYNITDLNGKHSIGFEKAQANLRNGRRCSAAKAFINPIIGRKNLHISMNAWVTKIVIDPKTKTAIGVEFLKNRRRYFMKATKEVILSAGTIGSPQLLMLSGIGPKDHLNSLGINVIQDLKVGYNLQDHVSLQGLTFLVRDPITLSESAVRRPLHVLNYVLNSEGPFTLPGGAEGLAFLNTENTTNRFDSDYPNIEIVLGAGSLCGDSSGTLRNLIGITDEFYYKLCVDLFDKPSFGMVPVLLRPKSRGRIYLKDRNPFHWPHMQPNFMDHPDDRKTFIKGIRMLLEIANTKSFHKFGTRFLNKPFPGCEGMLFGSDQYWECCIKTIASSLQHQVGTCKMGPSSDPDAVVNPQLQVIGINHLRVVDGSIMPTIPAGHTNAAIFMIGEKAADMVKQFWS